MGVVGITCARPEYHSNSPDPPAVARFRGPGIQLAPMAPSLGLKFRVLGVLVLRTVPVRTPRRPGRVGALLSQLQVRYSYMAWPVLADLIDITGFDYHSLFTCFVDVCRGNLRWIFVKVVSERFMRFCAVSLNFASYAASWRYHTSLLAPLVPGPGSSLDRHRLRTHSHPSPLLLSSCREDVASAGMTNSEYSIPTFLLPSSPM